MNSFAFGSIRKVTFKDGTVQRYRILEISEIEHRVSYEVIESNPPSMTLAAFHSLTLKAVTHNNTTYAEFESQFASGEATPQVVEDSKYKKRELFADLAATL
ncbi:hypothetical protein HK101_005205 [Irineochytrium annulatum]|nr:hypothetical protein HK101_005205 [Irineochytrium annulatum]